MVAKFETFGQTFTVLGNAKIYLIGYGWSGLEGSLIMFMSQLIEEGEVGDGKG